MGFAAPGLVAGPDGAAATGGTGLPPIRSGPNRPRFRERPAKLDRKNPKSFQTVEPTRGFAPDVSGPERLVPGRDLDRRHAHFHSLSIGFHRLCRDLRRD